MGALLAIGNRVDEDDALRRHAGLSLIGEGGERRCRHLLPAAATSTRGPVIRAAERFTKTLSRSTLLFLRNSGREIAFPRIV